MQEINSFPRSKNQPHDDRDPFHQGHLQVSPLHSIYFEQVGRRDGKYILFLHGGPGGGISPEHRGFFDPEKYHAVLFDQRGCGRSRPHAELRENTTWDLVADIEKLRIHLNIESWIVFGGSWGSTLALAYAQSHPERVAGLILRGIFLCRKRELEWFYQEGASWIFPDAFEPYATLIPESERTHLIRAYYKRLTSSDSAIRLKAAQEWSTWEATTSRLLVDPATIAKYSQDEFALAFARIECHYFINGAFLERDDQLLKNCDRIQHIRTEIVQGRYDIVCPMESAWLLHKALPQSRLHVLNEAGHSMFEPSIQEKLIEITNGW